MKPPPEYIVSAFIVVLGILALIYKPYYEPDKRINLRKASIYQGYPHIELMQGGAGFGSILKGTFKLEGYGTGRLFLKKEIRPFIYIKFRNNDFVFLNLKSDRQTVDFYNELSAKIPIKLKE